MRPLTLTPQHPSSCYCTLTVEYTRYIDWDPRCCIVSDILPLLHISLWLLEDVRCDNGCRDRLRARLTCRGARREERLFHASGEMNVCTKVCVCIPPCVWILVFLVVCLFLTLCVGESFKLFPYIPQCSHNHTFVHLFKRAQDVYNRVLGKHTKHTIINKIHIK